MRSVSRNDPPCAWECLTWCWPPHHWWVHTTSWCPPLVGGCPPLVGAYHWLVGGQMWIKMDGPCRSTIDLSAGTLAGWLSASSDPDNVFDIRLALYSYYWPATHAHTYINISLCIFDEFIYISTFCWRNPKRSQLRVVSIVCKMATPPSRGTTWLFIHHRKQSPENWYRHFDFLFGKLYKWGSCFWSAYLTSRGR